jgi:hypothetical protein
MIHLATTFMMISLITIPAQAASRVSQEDIAACKALSENLAYLIRAGQTVISSRSQLRRCARMQRAELRRARRTAH